MLFTSLFIDAKDELRYYKSIIIYAALFENVCSGKCGEQGARPAYASVQSGQGLHCLLIELFHTREWMNVE